MEWHIDNFSCWNAEVHGEKISCPRVLSRLPSELHPKGQGGRLEVRLLGGRAGDLFFLGPDSTPICSRLVNGDGEQPSGPTFEEVVARIKKVGTRDRLTLQFRCANGDRTQHLRSVIDAFDATLEMDPKKMMQGQKDISCFDFPGNKKFKSFIVSLSDDLRFELTPSGISKGFSLESKILIRSCLSVLDKEKSVFDVQQNEHVFRDDTPWTFSDPINMLELHEKGLILLLKLKVIPGSVSRGLCHLPFTPVGVDTISDPADSLSNDLMSLYQDQEFCDFELICKGVVFPTHKAILGGRSPVFKRLLLSDMQEAKDGKAVIKDLDPGTLGLFLEFLYTGTVDGVMEVDSALKLYYAANKYLVPSLRRKCAEILCDGLSVPDLGDVLSFADRYQDGMIMSAVRRFVVENYEEVLASVEWRGLEERDPALAKETIDFCNEKRNCKIVKE